jgi:hypothetical protein
METFTLWHPHFDRRRSQFTFYATWVQIQRINRGTREMVRTMLDDMGLEKVAFSGWSLSHFATDFVSDNRDSGDWQDRWMDTCEIRVKTRQAVSFSPPASGFVGTEAFDDTFEDDVVPDRCVVLARFPGADDARQGFEWLRNLERSRNGEIAHDGLAKQVPARLLEDVAEALGAGRPQRRAAAVSVSRPAGFPQDVELEMPADLDFFESGATLAVLLERVCHELGAATYWRDAELADADRRG